MTVAAGFTPPTDHFKKYDILNVSIGTDPNLALRTRRGTGYYKLPSIKGVWYRGPFEHNGSVMTLKIGSIHAACVMIACRRDSKGTGPRRGRSRDMSLG